MKISIPARNAVEEYINRKISGLHKEVDTECKRLMALGITDITIISFSYDPYKWFISIGEKEYQAMINATEGI